MVTEWSQNRSAVTGMATGTAMPVAMTWEKSPVAHAQATGPVHRCRRTERRLGYPSVSLLITCSDLQLCGLHVARRLPSKRTISCSRAGQMRATGGPNHHRTGPRRGGAHPHRAAIAPPRRQGDDGTRGPGSAPLASVCRLYVCGVARSRQSSRRCAGVSGPLTTSAITWTT